MYLFEQNHDMSGMIFSFCSYCPFLELSLRVQPSSSPFEQHWSSVLEFRPRVQALGSEFRPPGFCGIQRPQWSPRSHIFCISTTPSWYQSWKNVGGGVDQISKFSRNLCFEIEFFMNTFNFSTWQIGKSEFTHIIFSKDVVWWCWIDWNRQFLIYTIMVSTIFFRPPGFCEMRCPQCRSEIVIADTEFHRILEAWKIVDTMRV